MNSADTRTSTDWAGGIGIAIAMAPFATGALSPLTLLQAFTAGAAGFFLLLLPFLWISWSGRAAIGGAAAQYLLITALAMPIAAVFQTSFWSFVASYSVSWWILFILLMQVAQQIKGSDQVTLTYFGLAWLMFIPIGWVLRLIWLLVKST